MSDLGNIYNSLSEGTEIFVVAVRMKEDRLYIPTDDSTYAIMGVDYFLMDDALGLFASKEKMEAWFEGADITPAKDLPIEVHIPSEIVSENGFIPIYRMRFLTEEEYAELVAKIQQEGVAAYRIE